MRNTPCNRRLDRTGSSEYRYRRVGQEVLETTTNYIDFMEEFKKVKLS